MYKKLKIKTIFSILILLFSISLFFFNKNDVINNSKLIKDSNIYLNIDSNKVEYYRIKRGEDLYCDVISSNGDSYLCNWYFSKSEEPMVGWISSEDVIFKNGDLTK